MFKKQQGQYPFDALGEAELREALAALRAQGALCYASLSTTNQGIAAEFSFNPVIIDTASGRLEVALKEAAIEIRSAHLDPSWKWNSEFMEIADSLASEVEASQSKNDLASMLRTQQVDAKFDARGKLKAILGEAELGSSLSSSDKSDHRRESSRAANSKLSWKDPHLQVSRNAERFRIEFSSGPFSDLVPLNTRLGRLPLLDLKEPAAAGLNEVTATLLLNSDLYAQVVKHAFHIRQATGGWRALAENPQRRAVYELVLSKFLAPAHAPQIIWPHGTRI